MNYTLTITYYRRTRQILAFQFASIGDALRMLAGFMDDENVISAILARHTDDNGDNDAILFDSGGF